MKLAILFSTILLFLQTGWEEFTSLDGRFRVVAPGYFTEKTDSVITDVGTLTYHTFFIQTDDKNAENLFYMVSYCDYPEGVIFVDSAELVREFFQATMETAAQSVKGVLLYDTDIQLGEYPGKLWRIDYLDGKAVIKTKAYLVNRRYYSLQTISYKEKNINASADRFFDSFLIL